MAMDKNADLFASDVNRRIEEVIKVDQTDDETLRAEMDEYVVTPSIRQSYASILERYQETPNKPHEGVAIWVSGFFGSGKSSFAKMLGLALENREIGGRAAAKRFADRVADQRTAVLVNSINERIPTEAVVFDLSTDRGIRSGNQMLTEIMYREFLEHLGYARDLDLAELEITLEEEGRLDLFKQTYSCIFTKEWDAEKGKVAFALSQASRVMRELEPDTYSAEDSWVKAAKDRADVTANMLAERTLALMARRRHGRSLVFVIDEVGQFVARDVQKMLDLQGIVQALGRVGKGKAWVCVTSQERLGDIVGGMDDKRVELARLMDRFPQELQVHLEPSDISEVTSKRVLAKNADAETALRKLFEDNRGRLLANTRVSADIRLPELTAESFIALYPLLPYQIDLIIQIVSGLRTQGGASRHVGGANRTIIKLAQQLLINPAVALGEEPLGKLATIENIYDLVRGNIDSQIRDKIDRIPKEVDHPLGQAVAKAICLMQFVKSVHRTPKNIAATLCPAVDADSLLSDVHAALAELETRHLVRRGEGGYRIPSPAEDDWERRRAGIQPKPADVNRLHGQIMEELWQPQPTFNLLDKKLFRAGMVLNGRPRVSGDMDVHVYLAEPGKEHEDRLGEARALSQTEDKGIFWVVRFDDPVDRATSELFRSEQMAQNERSAQTEAEHALAADEKRRMNHHRAELKRLVQQACLNGTVFFRGNDRSPDGAAQDMGKAVSEVMGAALPEVFDRFAEGAARVQKQDLEALIQRESLHGLTPVFSELNLLRTDHGKPVFAADAPPLSEVLARIENDYSYGQASTGKGLAEAFGRMPYGWDFDVVKLFCLALLRAGAITVTAKGQTLETVENVEVRNVFLNNTLFRAAKFQPKKTLDFPEIIQAADHYKNAFGTEIPELTQTSVMRAIRGRLAESAEELRQAETDLKSHKLPGSEVLTEAAGAIRSIETGSEENAILTFNGTHAELKEAIQRARQLGLSLTEPALARIAEARATLERDWPFLAEEPDTPDALRQQAGELADILRRETFFQQIPVIDQNAKAIRDAYCAKFQEAAAARAGAYAKALEILKALDGWDQLEPDQQERLAAPLANRAEESPDPATPVPQLRADVDACPKRLQDILAEARRIVEGARMVELRVSDYVNRGIENMEQLDAAIQSLRDECEKLIAAGKKVFLQ